MANLEDFLRDNNLDSIPKLESLLKVNSFLDSNKLSFHDIERMKLIDDYLSSKGMCTLPHLENLIEMRRILTRNGVTNIVQLMDKFRKYRFIKSEAEFFKSYSQYISSEEKLSDIVESLKDKAKKILRAQRLELDLYYPNSDLEFRNSDWDKKQFEELSASGLTKETKEALFEGKKIILYSIHIPHDKVPGEDYTYFQKFGSTKFVEKYNTVSFITVPLKIPSDMFDLIVQNTPSIEDELDKGAKVIPKHKIIGKLHVSSLEEYNDFDYDVAQKIADDISLLIANNKVLERLKSRMIEIDNDLKVSANVLQTILPNYSFSTNLAEIKLSNNKVNVLLKEKDSVGGDFYNVFDSNGINNIYQVDIEGHGFSPALHIVWMQNKLQESLSKYPPKLAHYHFAKENLTGDHLPNICINSASINSRNGLMEFARDGAYNGAILRAKGDIEFLESKEDFLEIMLNNNYANYVSLVPSQFRFISKDVKLLNKGDRVIFYTDGISELDLAKNNSDDTPPDYKDLIRSIFADHPKKSNSELITNISTKINDILHGEKASDDLSLLIYQFNGATYSNSAFKLSNYLPPERFNVDLSYFLKEGLKFSVYNIKNDDGSLLSDSVYGDLLSMFEKNVLHISELDVGLIYCLSSQDLVKFDFELKMKFKNLNINSTSYSHSKENPSVPSLYSLLGNSLKELL